MNATVTWSAGMSFSGSADSGFSLPLDASTEVGGQEAGFQPMELMLVSLAGCTAMDVISILQKKRQTVTGFRVQAEAERAETHPRAFTRVHLRYILTGKGLDPAAVQRAVELSETKYCPAQAMLRPAVPITSSVEIYEAG
jgi:putative redox protein